MDITPLFEFEPNADRSYPVYTIDSPHQLTQIAGYYRYKQDGGRVYFRGTSSFHESSIPSLFRDSNDPRTSPKPDVRQQTLKTYISTLEGTACACPAHTRNSGRLSFADGHLCTSISRGRRDNSKLVAGTHRAVVEPLLQHYGLRTRWLDVVDNIWVALWFATNRYVDQSDKPSPKGNSARAYAFHIRRSAAEPPEAKEAGDPKSGVAKLSGHNEDEHAFANIYLHRTGSLAATEIPGYSIAASCRVVDLRYSVPSLYLRPHAQHGVLMARRRQPSSTLPPSEADYSLNSTVVAVIRVRLVDALDWLGNGILANHHSLFPPAAVDVGYRYLLSAPMPPLSLGSITIYQGGL